MSLVLVMGASPNPDRFSNKAIRHLLHLNHEVAAIGKRQGMVGDVPIVDDYPHLKDVHTVLIYLSPPRQPGIVDYIISLKPKRVVFNPGTENHEFEELLKSHDIKVVRDCSLMMMGSGRF